MAYPCDNHVMLFRAGQFKYPAVQRYVHDLTGEMGEHLDSIASSLSMFIEIGSFLTPYPRSLYQQSPLDAYCRCTYDSICAKTRRC